MTCMTCSACLTNALRYFFGTFRTVTLSRAQAPRKQPPFKVRGRRLFNNCSIRPSPSLGIRSLHRQSLDPNPSTKFNDSFLPFVVPPPKAAQRLDLQRGSRGKWLGRVDSHVESEGREMIKVRSAVAYGGEGLRETSGRLKQQVGSKNELSFDQDWWRENTQGLVRRGGCLNRNSANADSPKRTAGKGQLSSRSMQSQDMSKVADQSRQHELRDTSSEEATEKNNSGMTTRRSAKSSVGRTDARRGYRPREPWQIQKRALSEKFGSSSWSPRKRLSPDTLEGIRVLHAQYPAKYTTPVLADQFKVSAEAIRRILKSKWRPNEEEEESRAQRWNKRGANIWSQMVEVGIKPPKKWRDMGAGHSGERTLSRNGHNILPAKPRSGIISSAATTEPTTVPAFKRGVEMEIRLAERIV
ncbi:Required for respiratory growth protein 9 mitochondrial [Mycoblastus sanguinarius]|nr:Required for respiratory growth protein 9 mitochondrial [Mycoblastus sanguinarius]